MRVAGALGEEGENRWGGAADRLSAGLKVIDIRGVAGISRTVAVHS